MLFDGYTVTIGADVGAIRGLKRCGALAHLLRQVHNILMDLLLVAGLATAVLQDLFGTPPIGLRDWGILLLVAVNVLWIMEVER